MTKKVFKPSLIAPRLPSMLAVVIFLGVAALAQVTCAQQSPSRLLGVGKKRQTVSQLSDALFVWNWIGFGIAVLGGFLLFSISATIYVKNPAFRIKLGVLIPLALLLHIVIQKRARAWDQEDTPMTAKLAGLAELTLWFCVAGAAVLIPYFFGPGDLP